MSDVEYVDESDVSDESGAAVGAGVATGSGHHKQRFQGEAMTRSSTKTALTHELHRNSALPLEYYASQGTVKYSLHRQERPDRARSCACR